jgi:leucyl-tRNA---protein transferase
MRKSLSKNEGVTVEIGKPECDREHIELHNIYHQYKTKTKYWPAHNISLTEYRMLFCEPMPFAKEIRYRNKDGELIGVGYIDVLPSAHSSLYFFYNPSWAQQSPGIFSIMTEINYARELGAKYYHLGYYVKDCPSMDYKLRFTPHDLLQGKDTFWNWDETEWEIDHF